RDVPRPRALGPGPDAMEEPATGVAVNATFPPPMRESALARVRVGDRRFEVPAGRTVLPLPAGRHELRFTCDYGQPRPARDVGAASLTVEIEPGRVLEVHYAGPWYMTVSGLWFFRGRAGFRRRRSK